MAILSRLIVALVLALACTGVANAAQLNSVQSGTTTIADGASSATATLTSVDTTRSFLVFNVAINTADPLDGQISGQLTNATTVTFARAGTATAVTVKWHVAEFTSGVSVQRGSLALTAASTDVTLGTSVAITRSFPLVSFRTDGACWATRRPELFW